MKLKIVLLTLLTLVYGSTQALNIQEIVIEEGLLDQNGMQDLKTLIKLINSYSENKKTHQVSRTKINDRVWRSISKFLRDHKAVCLEDRDGTLYFIRKMHKSALHINNEFLMVNNNGIGISQNMTPGKYKDVLRLSIKEHVKRHNSLLQRGIYTDITGQKNMKIDIRARGFKNLTQKEMLKILAKAGVKRLGCGLLDDAFDGELDITTYWNNNNNNSVYTVNSNNLYNSDESDYENTNKSWYVEDELEDELGDESYGINDNLTKIIQNNNNNNHSQLLEEEIIKHLQNGNNNNNDDSFEYSYFSDDETDFNESGYINEDGEWVPNNNCHKFYFDTNNNFRYDRGCESE